jgi:hypothetical protein
VNVKHLELTRVMHYKSTQINIKNKRENENETGFNEKAKEEQETLLVLSNQE